MSQTVPPGSILYNPAIDRIDPNAVKICIINGQTYLVPIDAETDAECQILNTLPIEPQPIELPPDFEIPPVFIPTDPVILPPIDPVIPTEETDVFFKLLTLETKLDQLMEKVDLLINKADKPLSVTNLNVAGSLSVAGSATISGSLAAYGSVHKL